MTAARSRCPVNYVVDQHSVLFRTDEGTKLDAASRGARVAFEVDGAEEATRTGWSVLVGGGRGGHRPGRTRPGAPAAAVALGAGCQDPLCPDSADGADGPADRPARGRTLDLVGLAADQQQAFRLR